MDDFWRAWAAKELESQWHIYRRPNPFPGVSDVTTRVDPWPAFVVTTTDGSQFVIVPSGVARPMIRRKANP